MLAMIHLLLMQKTKVYTLISATNNIAKNMEKMNGHDLFKKIQNVMINALIIMKDITFQLKMIDRRRLIYVTNTIVVQQLPNAIILASKIALTLVVIKVQIYANKHVKSQKLK